VKFSVQKGGIEMPFRDSTVFDFNWSAVARLREVGGVYGLCKPNPLASVWYIVLYVGKTGDLTHISILRLFRRTFGSSPSSIFMRV
jgi:hypothetical protein